MQLITNFNGYNNNSNLQQQKKKEGQLNFKGYTLKPRPIVVNHGYNPSSTSPHIVGYEVPQNATPNYPGAYPNKDTKIYKASPFEIISEATYKKHDYTIRNDLKFSDIKNSYDYGYQNYAENAYLEKNFLSDLLIKSGEKIKEHNYYIDEYNKRLDFTKSDVAKSKFTSKINNVTDKLKQEENQKQILSKTLDNANERFSLLNTFDHMIDDRGNMLSKKSSALLKIMEIGHTQNGDMEVIESNFKKGHEYKQKYKKYIKESDNKVNKAISQGVSGKELQKIFDEEVAYKQSLNKQYTRAREGLLKTVMEERRLIQNHTVIAPKLKENIKQLTEQIAQINIKIEKMLAKIEKFYKAKYPNWL